MICGVGRLVRFPFFNHFLATRRFYYPRVPQRALYESFNSRPPQSLSSAVHHNTRISATVACSSLHLRLLSSPALCLASSAQLTSPTHLYKGHQGTPPGLLVDARAPAPSSGVAIRPPAIENHPQDPLAPGCLLCLRDGADPIHDGRLRHSFLV